MKSILFRHLLFVCLILVFFLNSISIAQPNSRIIDGEIAATGLYPYMASIVSKEKKNGYKHHCGASIINDRYLLTAAHCVGTGDYVLVGSQDITKRGGSTSLEISGFIIHPDFMYLMMEADIALLKVYGELGQPLVYLPEMSEEDPAIGKTHARVVGWGRTNERRKKKISKRLKHGQVNLISYAECESRFDQVKEVNDIGAAELPEHLICLQKDPLAQNIFESASPCNGDSGSPLLVNQEEQLVQVGVASFILGDCGSRLLGSGYT
ncbi:MAG: serine protease, partial [Bdellovibrionota bacterium]